MADTIKKTSKHRLNILQWNCRSINNKTAYLKDYLRTYKETDVIMLQSLNTTRNRLPPLEGYYDPYISTEDKKVMTATYISNRLQADSLPALQTKTTSRFFSSAVKIRTLGKDINLLNIYYPDSCRKERDLDWLQELKTDTSWIIGGDFNTSHCQWDTGQKENNGQQLANAIAESNLTILNDGSFTRLGQKHQRNTAIDLTLCTPDIFLDASWNTGMDHLQSDHLPIHITIDKTSPNLADYDQEPKYMYNKADWKTFSQLLERECLQTDPAHPDIDIYYQNIREIILKAADTTIPKRSPTSNLPTQHNDAWWNEACDTAKREKRRALANCQKNQSEHNHQKLQETSKKFEEVVNEAKKEYWEQFLNQEIKTYHDAPKVWKKIRQMKRRKRQPERALTINGSSTKNNNEKAEALAKTFATASQTAHLPLAMQQKRQEEERNFSPPVPDNSNPINSDINIQEVQTVIKGIKKANKATGTDPISYRMIRHFPIAMMILLTTFYQTCWTTGTLPSAWKTATVIGIPKEGKPRNNPDSYRPISLTAHLGKVYEQIIKQRLEYHLEKHKILPICQTGFRKGRQCMEHVVHLMEDSKKWTWTKGNSTIATFFDIKKAFDTVWHAKLLHKLGKIGITGHMHDFISAFLDSRKIAVKVGSTYSSTHNIDMGVPQGSVIAPILFTIMLHDIQQSIQKGKQQPTITLYADDLALWTNIRERSRVSQMENYQRHIDSIQHYMTDNGFTLSPEKTTLMAFSKTPLRLLEYHIKLKDKIILPSKQVKFLGVTITGDLSFATHLRRLRDKAQRSVNLIKILTRETWTTPDSLIQLANALIRSKLMYGHEAYLTATEKQWKEHQRPELCALKHAMGVSQHAINDLTYQEAGWLPLQNECQRRSANFEARVNTTNNNVKHALQEKQLSASMAARRRRQRKTKPRQYQKTRHLRDYTQELWDIASRNPKETVPMPDNKIPTWIMEQATIITDYAISATKRDNPLQIATIAKETLHTRYQHHLQVFTDGSIQDNGDTGCALVIPALKVTKSYKLNKGISIYSAEMFAILQACSYINDLPNPPSAAIILTDSKSSLQTLCNQRRDSRQELQKEIQHLTHQIITKGTDLTMHWIPSHCGIAGNEMADRAAKMAATIGTPMNLGLSLSEITAKLRQAAIYRRNAALQDRCKDKGWIFLPLKRQTRQKIPLPRKHQQVIRRIRTGAHRLLVLNLKFNSGSDASLSHALSDCPDLPNDMNKVSSYRKQHQLQTQDFITPHPTLGFAPMRMLADCLLKTGLDNWF